jgi:hypothetical protein
LSALRAVRAFSSAVRLKAGSCVHQPPEFRHREIGHSEDIEMLKVVLPGNFETNEVDRVQP